MAAITSNQTGLASATSTWVGGVVPVEGDSVTIAAGHTVTIDGTYTWGDDTAATSVSSAGATGGAIRVNGTLKASRSVSSSLTAKGDLVITATGTLDYGTSADPIPSTYTATMLLNKAASAASVKYGLITINGSQFYSYGAAKVVNTTLTQTANSAQNQIVVADATGWAVNDRLILHSTTSTSGNYDERTISTITPGSGTTATITLNSNLTYQHLVGCSVGNFTHNVAFKSFAAATPGYIAQQWANTQTAATRVARYTLFENLGESGSANVYKWSGWAVSLGSTPTVDPMLLRDCSFYTLGNTLSIGLSAHNIRIRTTISDIAIAGNSTRAAVYEASGTVWDIYRMVVYRCSNAVESGYSQGGVACRHYDCRLYGAASRGFSGTATGAEFYNCDFGAIGNEIAIFDAVFGAKFSNCTFGSVFPIAGTVAFRASTYGAAYSVTLENCYFQSALPVVNTSTAGARIQDSAATSKIIVADKGGDPLQQEIYTPGGIISRDNSFARDASGTSLKMAPHSASSSFSFDLYIYAPNNKPVVVSGYLYVNTAYGTTYPATVTLSGLGITPSTWTDNTSVRDAWQQFLVGATQTTGSDGMLKLTVTVQGSAGAVWVDGVSAPTPVAVNSGEFGYWSQGLPAGIISANYVAASDVWNTLTSDLTLAGSIGKRLTDNVNAAISAVPAAVLTAAQATPINAEIIKVAGETVTGSGTELDPWGPTP